MVTYTKEQLAEILKKHAAWLRGEANGVRANLYGANLHGADLSGDEQAKEGAAMTHTKTSQLGTREQRLVVHLLREIRRQIRTTGRSPKIDSPDKTTQIAWIRLTRHLEHNAKVMRKHHARSLVQKPHSRNFEIASSAE